MPSDLKLCPGHCGLYVVLTLGPAENVVIFVLVRFIGLAFCGWPFKSQISFFSLDYDGLGLSLTYRDQNPG